MTAIAIQESTRLKIEAEAAAVRASIPRPRLYEQDAVTEHVLLQNRRRLRAALESLAFAIDGPTREIAREDIRNIQAENRHACHIP